MKDQTLYYCIYSYNLQLCFQKIDSHTVVFVLPAPYAAAERLFDSIAILPKHRLEAACIPTNAASIALLEKTGFQREGYARAYLCINGLWQDHLLYARLRDDPD